MSENIKKRNARMRVYKKKPEVKTKTREQKMNRYHSDPKYRRKTLDKSLQWQKKHNLGLGDPENIKSMCKEFDFSDEVAEAIALDGDILDKKLKEKKVEK